MIKVEALRKSFGNVEAVKKVSFVAEDGQIMGLLGENGAGKSTTLRMIAGVLKADHGEIYLNGTLSRYGDAKSRSKIGILSDARGLYDKLTTRENIELFANIYGLSGNGLKKKVDEVIDILDITDISNRKTTGFSTGQKMKVALGRVLVGSPKNLVFDEPTSGLDVLSTRNFREIIRRLRDRGHCVVLSSHIMQEIDQVCEFISIIDKGSSVAYGSKQEIMTQTGSANIEDAFTSFLLRDK